MIGARLRSPGAISTFILLATVVAVRAVRPYRPFPSIDDFAYVPLAWAWRDPALFPRDALMRAFVHHTPAWDIIVAALDVSIGEVWGFWLLTILLTVGTLTAVLRLMRSSGVSALLLPAVAALAFCGPVIGFGRGAYDGALGDGFHVQWLALCALLWSYDAFVRSRMRVAGAWLGVATLCHPVVATHGAIVLAMASLVAGRGRWSRLPALAAIAAVVSLPLTLPLLHSMLGGSSGASPTGPDLVRLGYEFRAPHHYVPGLTPPSTWMYLGLMMLGGVGAARIERPSQHSDPVRALAGLLIGQAVLVAAFLALHGELMPARWRYASSLPYLLDLSRSSGLILPLAAILLLGALELRPVRRPGTPITRELLWTGILAVVVTAFVLYGAWRLPLAGLVLLSMTLRVLGPAHRGAWALWLAVITVVGYGVVRIGTDTVRTAPLSREEADLFQWAAATPPNSLFIVPPGLQEFRFYTRRSVYVDFKLFPPATPATTPVWRRRMDLVASPDRLALNSPGWLGVPQWDRTFANRNTPARIAKVLQETGADYFLWDRHGLDVPPYVAVNRPPDPGAVRVFGNQRFEVYAARADGR